MGLKRHCGCVICCKHVVTHKEGRYIRVLLVDVVQVLLSPTLTFVPTLEIEKNILIIISYPNSKALLVC